MFFDFFCSVFLNLSLYISTPFFLVGGFFFRFFYFLGEGSFASRGIYQRRITKSSWSRNPSFLYSGLFWEWAWRTATASSTLPLREAWSSNMCNNSELSISSSMPVILPKKRKRKIRIKFGTSKKNLEKVNNLSPKICCFYGNLAINSL